MMKIVFLMHHFESGGTEKVYLNLIEKMVKDGNECILMLFLSKGKLIDALPDSVQVIGFDTNINGIFDFVKIFRLSHKIRTVFDDIKPDIVYSGLWINNLVNVLSCKSKGHVRHNPVCVISDHINTYASMYYETTYKSLVWLKKFITKFYYNLADCVVCVSNEGRDDLINICGAKIAEKTIVIYNGVNVNDIILKSKETVDTDFGNYLVAVGRISMQKGYSYLIEGFKYVADKFNDVNLVIVGDDVSKNRINTIKLEKIATKLGIKDKVFFVGYQQNPYKHIARATALISSSVFEGFGLVLVESMLIGTPVIASRCKTGPGEILDGKTSEPIEYTEYGVLVKPRRSRLLSEAVEYLLENEQEKNKFIGNAAMRVSELFRLEDMCSSYKALFTQLIART